MGAGEPLPLPGILQRRLENMVRNALRTDEQGLNFLEPKGEEALLSYDSVSWRVFKNPLALFVGGVAAVILELAEPRVRTGVWQHSGFRSEPLRRIRRTGLAAMTTVYGPKGASARAIGRVNRLHEGIRGKTPAGQNYNANDPELLAWVHATAAFSFFQAYNTYVCTLREVEFDRFCEEGMVTATLYGAGAESSNLRPLFLNFSVLCRRHPSSRALSDSYSALWFAQRWI
jgi:uncharacterized protein (DUF2236 family)